MAKDQDTGERPAKTQAGSDEPQGADQSAIRAGVLEKFTEPGLSWKEAVEALKPLISVEDVRKELDSRLADWSQKKLRYSAAPIPYTASEPTNDGILNNFSQMTLFELLKNRELVMSGQIDNAFERKDIESIQWIDKWVWRYNNKLYRPSTKTTISNIRIVKAPTVFVDESQEIKDGPNVNKGPGGRPTKYDWDDLLQTWLRRLIGDRKGFPKDRKQAYEIFLEVCDNLIDGDERPAITQFAKELRKIYPEIADAIGILLSDVSESQPKK